MVHFFGQVAPISYAQVACRLLKTDTLELHAKIILLGLDGVTVVDEWDSAGVPKEEFTRAIEVSMVLPVRSPHQTGRLCFLGCCYAMVRCLPK